MAVIVAASVLGGAWNYRFRSQETIVVTGLATEDFSSDYIVWSGSFSKKNIDLKEAYSGLKADEDNIRKYFIGKGIPDSTLVFSSIAIDKQFENIYDNQGNQTAQRFSGYELTQSVTIESEDLDKIEAVSRQVTELIQQGIESNSEAPSYYYTSLSNLKIDLLAKAASDAQKRAETISDNSGGSLGELVKSSMGVFQITGYNLNEDYSYGGAFNTSSRYKTASITVRSEFRAN
ncbi:MAG: SIMPL domain-containing protein [Bacteroidota bacterium]